MTVLLVTFLMIGGGTSRGAEAEAVAAKPDAGRLAVASPVAFGDGDLPDIHTGAIPLRVARNRLRAAVHWADALPPGEFQRLALGRYVLPSEPTPLPIFMARYENARTMVVAPSEAGRALFVRAVRRRVTRREEAALPPVPYRPDEASKPRDVRFVTVNLADSACRDVGAIRADLCGAAVAPAAADRIVRFAVVAHGLDGFRAPADRAERVAAIHDWSESNPDAVVYLLLTAVPGTTEPRAGWSVAWLDALFLDEVEWHLEQRLGAGADADPLLRAFRANAAVAEALVHPWVLQTALRDATIRSGPEAGKSLLDTGDLGGLLHRRIVAAAGRLGGRDTADLERALFALAARSYPTDACPLFDDGRWLFSRTELELALGAQWTSGADSVLDAPSLRGRLFEPVSIGVEPAEDRFRFAVLLYQEYLAARGIAAVLPDARAQVDLILSRGVDPAWREVIPQQAGLLRNEGTALALLDGFDDARAGRRPDVREDIFASLRNVEALAAGALPTELVARSPNLQAHLLRLAASIANDLVMVGGWDLSKANDDVRREQDDALRRLGRHGCVRDALIQHALRALTGSGGAESAPRWRVEGAARVLGALGPVLDPEQSQRVWSELRRVVDDTAASDDPRLLAAFAVLAEVSPALTTRTDADEVVHWLHERNRSDRDPRVQHAAGHVLARQCVREPDLCLAADALPGGGLDLAGWQSGQSTRGPFETEFVAALTVHAARDVRLAERIAATRLMGDDIERVCKERFSGRGAGWVDLCSVQERAGTLEILGRALATWDQPGSDDALRAVSDALLPVGGALRDAHLPPLAACAAVGAGRRGDDVWSSLEEGLEPQGAAREEVYRWLRQLPCDRRDFLERHRAASQIALALPSGADTSDDRTLVDVLLGDPDWVSPFSQTRGVTADILARVLAIDSADGQDAEPLRLVRLLALVTPEERPAFLSAVAPVSERWDPDFESFLWRCPEAAALSDDLRFACLDTLAAAFGIVGPTERFQDLAVRLALAPDSPERLRSAGYLWGVVAIDWTREPRLQHREFLRALVDGLEQPSEETCGPTGAAHLALWVASRHRRFNISARPVAIVDSVCASRAILPPVDGVADRIGRAQTLLELGNPSLALDELTAVQADLDTGRGPRAPDDRASLQMKARLLQVAAFHKRENWSAAAGVLEDILRSGRSVDAPLLDRVGIGLGETYIAAGRFDDALPAFERARQQCRVASPDLEWKAVEGMARALSSAADRAGLVDGRPSDAAAKQHCHAVARAAEAEELRLAGRFERGCDDPGRATASAPECDDLEPSGVLFIVWADSLWKSSDRSVAEALAILDVAESLLPGGCGPCGGPGAFDSLRGIILFEGAHDPAAAYASMVRARDADPTNVNTRLNLAEVAFANAKFREAIQEIDYVLARKTLPPHTTAVARMYRLLSLAADRATGGRGSNEDLVSAAHDVAEAFQDYPPLGSPERTWMFDGIQTALDVHGRLPFRETANDIIEIFKREGSEETRRDLGDAMVRLLGRVECDVLNDIGLAVRRHHGGEGVVSSWREWDGVGLDIDSVRSYFDVDVSISDDIDLIDSPKGISLRFECRNREAEPQGDHVARSAPTNRGVRLFFHRPLTSDGRLQIECTAFLQLFGGTVATRSFSFSFAERRTWLSSNLLLLAIVLGIALGGFFGLIASGAVRRVRTRRRFRRERQQPFDAVIGVPIRQRAALVGRDAELDRVAALVGAPDVAHWTVVVGETRMGKTSVLLVLRDEIVPARSDDAYRFVPVYVGWGQSTDGDDLLPRLVSRAAEEAAPDVMASLRVRRKEAPDYAQADAVADLRAIAAAVRTQEYRALRLVFLIDEADALASLPEPRQLALRHLLDQARPVIRFVTTALNNPRVHQPHKSDLYAQSAIVPLPPLGRDGVAQIIQRPLSGLMSFTDEALDVLHLKTGGIPYLAQMYGAWIVTQGHERGVWRVTAADVALVEPRVREILRLCQGTGAPQDLVVELVRRGDEVFRSMLREGRDHLRSDEREHLRELIEKLSSGAPGTGAPQ